MEFSQGHSFTRGNLVVADVGVKVVVESCATLTKEEQLGLAADAQKALAAGMAELKNSKKE